MEKLLIRVYRSRGVSLALKIISYAAVLIFISAYALLLYLSYRNGGIWAAVRLAALSALPFAVVTVVRGLIDAPRPYELYTFYEVKPKGKAGRSFPSRHVFSAVMLATIAIPTSVPLAAALYALAAALAIARVLLGIHFIRDVLAGAAIGAVSGALAILI